MAQNSLTARLAGLNDLAPDLAKLPIVRNLRGFSVAEGVRAALSVSVIMAANEYFHLSYLPIAALGALWTCLCDPGGPVGRRVPALLSFTVIGGLATSPVRCDPWRRDKPIWRLGRRRAAMTRPTVSPGRSS
jgi:hypothetical protein